MSAGKESVMAKKKVLRNVMIWVFAVLSLLSLTVIFFIFPNGIVFPSEYRTHFWGSDFYELYSFQTPYEKQIGEETAVLARECMEYSGSREDAPEVGALSVYYGFDHFARPERAAADADVSMKKTALYGDTGNVWVVYTNHWYNENGEHIYGSSDVLARYTIERDEDGKWTVTKVTETP